MTVCLTVAASHETLELTDEDRLADDGAGLPSTEPPPASKRTEPAPLSVAASGESGTAEIAQGDVLAGKYQVEKVLGRGGMGAVVSAFHLQLRDRVALKFLHAEVGRSEEHRARFLREARVAAKLGSENIARVTDVGVLDNGAPYMVMELVEGLDLRALLDQERVLDVPRAVEVVVQACRGLADAHVLGIVHRDLKPSNLLISRRRDGTELIKILDFGISKAGLANDPELDDLTVAGTLLGSPKYMAPEQIASADPVDERADVWSLGVILYEALAGSPPFLGRTSAATCMRVLGSEPPASILARRPDVPSALEAAVFRALRRSAKQRTSDVATFAEEIVDALGIRAPPHLILAAEQTRGIIDSRMSGSAGSKAGPSIGGDPPLPPAGTKRGRRHLFLGVTALAFLGGGGLAALAMRPEPSSSVDMLVAPARTRASLIATETAAPGTLPRLSASVVAVTSLPSASAPGLQAPSSRATVAAIPRDSNRKLRPPKLAGDAVAQPAAIPESGEVAVDPLADRQ